MKKLLGIAVAAAMLAAVASTYAGEAKMSCCAGKHASDAGCAEMSSKLNLTADQQARITALNGQLSTATSKSERRAMFDQGIQRILTADQYAQWKSSCDKKVRTGACPLKATPAKCGKSK
jgi:Spy/CpxP family protein refolding chaperone